MKKQLEHIKKQPEHVRRQYAYTTAGALTLSIFLIWGVTMVVARPLAYQGGSPAPQETNPITDLAGTFQSGLAGVTASFEDLSETVEQGRFEGEARLEIVDTEVSSTIEEEPERETVLTF